MNIREANKNDLDSLVHSLEYLIRYTQGSSSDPYIKDIDMDHQKWFKEVLKNPDGIVYIAEAEGNLTGFTIGKLSKPFVTTTTIDAIGLIDLCWVEPDYRGNGYSRALIKKTESWFKERGVEYVEIFYLASNREATQAWTHLGFEPYRIASRKKLK